MRYYYKNKNGKGFLNLKSPLIENIEEYVEITEEEFNNLTNVASPIVDKELIAKQQEISELKGKLASTDYQAIKYAEGVMSEEEYAPIRIYRQSLRDRINELEK